MPAQSRAGIFDLTQIKMIRIAALQKELTGLVGLMPHYNPALPQYAQDLLDSRSGLWLNNTHPLITPENLIAALPKVDDLLFQTYSAANDYKRGAIVTATPNAKGNLFICVKYAQGQLLTDTDYWLPTDYLSARLRQLLDAAVADVAAQLVMQKKLEGAKSVVSETQLYHGSGNIINRIVKGGRFCGLEIELKQSRDLVAHISRIGLQVDTPNPELLLYLYHSSQAAPIKVFKPNFTGSGTFAWGDVRDIYLALDSEAYGPGGVFMIGYYESDLQGQIIDRQIDWTNEVVVGCGTCDPQTYADFHAWNPYLSFHPFSVPAAAIDADRDLFNANKIIYAYKTNFGLNLNIALECDITQFLVRHQALLADAVAKQAGVNILQIFANSMENNRTAELAKQAALYQLDNRENYTPGLLKQLRDSLAALSLDVQSENPEDSYSPCLPKAPASKWRIKTGAK